MSEQQAATPADNYLIKFNNRNTVNRSGMCLNLIIKRPERRQQCPYC